MTQSEKWLAYTNGTYRGDIDFEGILGEYPIPPTLNELYGNLPIGGALIQRVRQFTEETVFNGAYFVPKGSQLPLSDLHLLLHHYHDFVIGGEYPELAEDLNIGRLISVDKIDEFENVRRSLVMPHADFVDLWTQELIDQRGDVNTKFPFIKGLAQSLSPLTMQPVITNYLLADYLDSDWPFELEYKVWNSGVGIAFGNDCTCIFGMDKLV